MCHCLPPSRRADITLRITFADAASVPRVVRLEHAPTPTAPFALLGDIRLQSKSLTQLRHLFRCSCGRTGGGEWGWQAGWLAGPLCRATASLFVSCTQHCSSNEPALLLSLLLLPCLLPPCRLGKHLEVQRCLRITLMGHMAEEHSGGWGIPLCH